MSATFLKMTNEITLHRIKISICASFSEYYFAKKNLRGPPSPQKERKTRRERKPCKIVLCTPLTRYIPPQKTYQKERKKTQRKNPWIEKFTLQRQDW